MTNAITNDIFEYELIGIGEEPLAKDHIIVNCVARKTSKVFIKAFIISILFQ